MAKRTKAYRGVPAEHRKAAVVYVRQARRAMKELSAALRESNCGEALLLFGELRAAEGAYLAHREGAGGGKYRGAYLLGFKKATRVTSALRKKCMRGSTR
jgi:hypothetical protein